MDVAATSSTGGLEQSWSRRYGQRHALQRITAFPMGVSPPAKMRIYWRRDHYVLQWWDPKAKANLSDRVDGDLIDALARAREIDQRLIAFRRSGHVRRRLTHLELVEAYLADLRRRAAAGEIAPRTVRRYESAVRHYLAFAAQPVIGAAYHYATGVDRDFALGLAAHLKTAQVSRNGHPSACKARMLAGDFVLDAVRAIYAWAADPERGNRLPDGFRNPFLRSGRHRRPVATDITCDPDITPDEAARFLHACDAYQLRLFAPYILCGLRAAEPVYLFYEFAEGDWLTVPCIGKLDHVTKGRRNKRLVLLPELKTLLVGKGAPVPEGLLFVRRAVAAGSEKPTRFGASLAELVGVYEGRLRRAGTDAFEVVRIRDAILTEAGATSYDRIQGEFKRVARALGWPAAATLKDFRHLFGTALANGGVPEHERRYLLGHAPGSAAIVAYTHLNKLAEHYRRAIEQELTPVLQALRLRSPGRDRPG